MKILAMALAFPLLLSDVARTDDSAQFSKPYVDTCEKAMALYSSEDQHQYENRFVEMADTPEKMIQLVYDYNLVFSKEFAMGLEAFLETRVASSDSRAKIYRSIEKVVRLSDKQLNKVVWEIMDKVVDLKSNGKTEALGQVSFSQTKNLVAALKSSAQKPLFEALARTVVRASLVDKAKSIRDSETVYKRSYVAATLGFLAPVIAGASLGWYFEHPIFGSIVGAAVTMMTGELWVELSKYLLEATDSKRIHKFKSLAPKTTYNVESAGKTVSLAADSIFKFLDKEFEHGVLSVDAGCRADVCQLSPVQIAYLGHIEVLELEALDKTLKEAMSTHSAEEIVNKISESARAVKDDPSNYYKQMTLTQELGEFLRGIKQSVQAREAAANALIAYAESIAQSDLDLLEAKPYTERPTTRDGALKNQMLLLKVQRDLNSLKELKVNSQAIAKKIERAGVIISNLESLIGQLPSGPSGWKEAAEEIIIKLDELR